MARFLTNAQRIIKIDDITPEQEEKWGEEECKTRRILATAYRLTHYFGWDDIIYGHITARVPGHENQILINPHGLHYTEITAASLLKIDTSGNIIDHGSTKFPFQPVGYTIHSAIHTSRPDLACVWHMHSRAGIALSAAITKIQAVCQANVELPNISYHDYRGQILRDEDREPLSRDFQAPSKALVMRNHGLLTGGKTVEEAFTIMYFLHQTCQCYVDTGYLHSPVPHGKVLSREVLESSMEGSAECRYDTEYGVQEFEALARLLDYQGFQTGYPYSELSRSFLDSHKD